MSTITILPDSSAEPCRSYRAIAGTTESSGKTVGEALDAINKVLTAADAVTLVVVQNDRPDRFFTANQQQRLAELMQRWRLERDSANGFSFQDRAELDHLIEAETRAAAERAEALIRGIRP